MTDFDENKLAELAKQADVFLQTGVKDADTERVFDEIKQIVSKEAGCIGLQEKKLFKKLYQERNKWTNDARAGQRICPLPWTTYL